MAPNKFATLVLRNTNRFTLTLTYALLEWILILLLLFASLLSHLAVKFAEVFGLKPPCPRCACLDRRADLICELHAKEISDLCYCPNHRKLADSRDLCEDCSPRFLSDGEPASPNCSCCGVSLDDYALLSSYMLLKTLSWNLIEGAKKQKSISEDYRDELLVLLCDGEKENVVENDESVRACVEVNGDLAQHLEFLVDYSGRKLVAVESGDSTTEGESRRKCDLSEIGDDENVLKGCDDVPVEEDEDLALGVDLNEVPNPLESVEMEEDEEHLVFHAKDPQLDKHTEAAPMENEAHVSNRIDIPDLNATETQNQESYRLGDEQVPGTKESLDEDVTNIERLKSELRAQQESLQALHTELEEERNCSEVAANQTMAMINRLQEEKAAIQMEAFQYQRLMEEQSEYDQEALQLLNDLLVKREKENQELAKELEVCKMKILDYETKENNGGVTMSFEECLAEFEDERLSILRQLQVLEDNGFVKEMNGESLFDANNDENGIGFDSNGAHNCYMSKEEKTVSGLHERLEALESDRDFFKNCVGSLRKGEKGTDFLRHLRNLELPPALTLVGTSTKEEDECMCVV